MAEQHPTGSNTSDDIALITRAQNGDTAAFGTLIRDAHGRMWAVCLSITGNHQDAEDAMQNALIYDSLNDKVAPPNALLNEQGWHNQAKTQVYHCVAKPFRAKCNR